MNSPTDHTHTEVSVDTSVRDFSLENTNPIDMTNATLGNGTKSLFPGLAGNLRFYNTMTRSYEHFEPQQSGVVSLYCCGPTVYNYQHIGNLRTYIFEDVLVRTLQSAGYFVKHAMNITDVGHLVSDGDEGDDKMALASKREGKKSHEIAEFYTEVFFNDCKKVKIIRPTIVCKATDHISQMIDLIQRLERNGFAYQSGGNVYFDVPKFEEYGALANIDISAQLVGARIEADERKRSPVDFALWFTDSKFSGQELQWDSPWGRGYPGWHIECSAMAIFHLGERVDIHCGGIDHIGAHHTNEIAQSEGALGHKWVKTWLHGAFLVDSTGKMSKSKGEFLTFQSLEKEGYDPMAYRLYCFSAHYRTELLFSWDGMRAAQTSLQRLRNSVSKLNNVKSDSDSLQGEVSAKYLSEFENAIADDMNCPRALAVLWAVLGDRSLNATTALNLVSTFDSVLGLNLLNSPTDVQEQISDAVSGLLGQRDLARKAKNWTESDRLRDKILELGYAIKDENGKQQVVKAIKN